MGQWITHRYVHMGHSKQPEPERVQEIQNNKLYCESRLFGENLFYIGIILGRKLYRGSFFYHFPLTVLSLSPKKNLEVGKAKSTAA